MVKKADLKEKEAFEQAVGIQGGFKGNLISLLKLFCAMLMFPLLVGLGRAFYHQLLSQTQVIRFSFLFGVITYVIIHLFILEPVKINDCGQLVIGKIFSFYKPLRTIMYSCVPFYAVFFFIVYIIVKKFSTVVISDAYAVFVIAFTIAMHCVVSARNLKKDSMDALKGDYFFSLFTVFLCAVVLLTAMFRLMLHDFSFVAMLREGFDYGVTTVVLICKQLFVVG